LLLPEIRTIEEYRRVYRVEKTWLPAMRAICQRHRLDPAGLVFAPPGTHVVFRAGPEWYIKLFAPLWPQDHVAESLVLGHLSAQSALPIPRLEAEGEIEGWPYLIMTPVEGVPLNTVWDSLDASQRRHIAEQCGMFMSTLHATPTQGLEPLATDWPAFVRDQTASCREGLSRSGLSEEWVQAVSQFLDHVPPLYEPGFGPVLLSADVTDEHVLVSPRGDRWEFTGFIDFGDAMLGHPLYEFAAPGCCITRDAPELQRAMLLAYGYTEDRLDETLADQLMAYTLLHRYMDVPDLLDLFGSERPASFAELRGRLWSFHSVAFPGRK
jgi:hygromycin-B 7''-O-kinase